MFSAPVAWELFEMKPIWLVTCDQYGCAHDKSAVDPKLHNRTSTLGEKGTVTCSRCRIHLNSSNELPPSSVVLKAVNQPKFMGKYALHMEMCISQRQ
jgi:hypothetical protein